MLQVESAAALVVWMTLGVGAFVVGLVLLRSARRRVLGSLGSSRPRPTAAVRALTQPAPVAAVRENVMAAGEPLAG